MFYPIGAILDTLIAGQRLKKSHTHQQTFHYVTITVGYPVKSTSPPFSCRGPALWSGWPGGSALTSTVSASAPPPPSPSESSGSTSGKDQEKGKFKVRKEKYTGHKV